MRKKLTFVVGIGGAAVLASGLLFAVSAQGGGTGKSTVSLASTSTALPAAVSTSPAGTSSTSPKWLPEGAALIPPTVGTEGADTGSTYSLAGKQNANTIPSSGLTDQNVATVHPATAFGVYFKAGTTSLPESMTDASLWDISKVDVGGWDATLATPKNGYGAYRIDWIDSSGYHVVIEERLKTVEGTSGIPASDLLKVAQSLYS